MSNSPESLLVARDLRKSYQMGRRSVEVLRGVSVIIEPGAFIALQGASGAGKSTLLHLLGGLDTPDAGEVIVSGRNLGRMNPADLSRFRNREVGFVFQAYHLLPELDALENVCLPGRISRKSAGAIRARAQELLDRVGLSARLDHRPSELSGGERQRVAIARSLINEPEILLADEPTGNLDSRTGDEILDLLCALREERKTTLVIATHDSKVAHRAPRVIQLVDGTISQAPAAEAT